MSKWTNILLDPEKKAIYDAGRAYERERVLEIIDRPLDDIGETNDNPEGKAYREGFNEAMSYLFSEVKALAEEGA